MWDYLLVCNLILKILFNMSTLVFVNPSILPVSDQVKITLISKSAIKNSERAGTGIYNSDFRPSSNKLNQRITLVHSEIETNSIA
jgi:hypothetical protein